MTAVLETEEKMISPEEAAAAAMTAEAAMPDPAIAALSVKSLVLDLPLAIAVEVVRFNVRVAMAWLDHVAIVAALNHPTDSVPPLEPHAPPLRVAAPLPGDAAVKIAA